MAGRTAGQRGTPEAAGSGRPAIKGRARLPQWGSKEHRTLLGIDDPQTTPERKADLEAILALDPRTLADTQVQAEEVQKVPITPDNYAPRTRTDPGDEIFDGWVRKGGQR
jgi:hypothetical protein